MDPILANFQALKGGASDASLVRLLSGGSQVGRIVADLGGGRASVNLGGRLFPLDLGMGRIPVGRGIVARMVNGQLQIALTQSASGAGAADAAMGTVSARGAASVLGDFGLPSSITNAGVASALIAAGIPLTRDLILNLARAVGQMEPAQVGALAFLLGRQLPISQEVLADVQRLLQRRQNFSRNLGRILDGLKNLDGELGDLDDEIMPVARRHSFQDHREELARHRQQWPTNGDGESEESPEVDAEGAETSKFADKLQKEEAEHRESVESVLVAGQPPPPESLAGRLLLLHQDLIALQAQLDLLGLAPNLTSLLILTQNAYESLAGERLANLPKQDAEEPPVYFFTLPFVSEGEESVLEFLYRQHTHNREDGGDLVLRMELSGLGPTRLQLGWRNGILTFGMRVEEAAVAERVEPHLEALKEALIAAGFRVADVRVDSGYVPETLRTELEPDIPPPLPRGSTSAARRLSENLRLDSLSKAISFWRSQNLLLQRLGEGWEGVESERTAKEATYKRKKLPRDALVFQH